MKLYSVQTWGMPTTSPVHAENMSRRAQKLLNWGYEGGLAQPAAVYCKRRRASKRYVMGARVGKRFRTARCRGCTRGPSLRHAGIRVGSNRQERRRGADHVGECDSWLKRMGWVSTTGTAATGLLVDAMADWFTASARAQFKHGLLLAVDILREGSVVPTCLAGGAAEGVLEGSAECALGFKAQ